MYTKTERRHLLGLVLFVFLALTLFAILFLTPKFMGFLVTGVTVNTPPTFNHSSPLANQSLNTNSSLSSVFDLDDYFTDVESATLSYRAFGNSSVSVSISSTNVVSFTSGSTAGSEVMHFYAYDEMDLNASSNNVTITVNAAGAGAGTGGGGGGGGGGGVSAKAQDPFSLEPELIEVRMRHGEAQVKSFSIKNNLKTFTKILLDLRSIHEFLLLERGIITKPLEEFSLSPFQKQNIELTFFADESMKPDAYLRRILIKSGTTSKELPVIVEIISRDIIFDVSLKIPESHKTILPGVNIPADIKITRVQGGELADLLLELSVRDFNGNIISNKSGYVSKKDDFSFREELPIPLSASAGKYVFIAKVTHKGKTAVASDTFDVVLEKKKDYTIYLLAAALLMLMILGFVVHRLSVLLKTRKVSQAVLEANRHLRIGERSAAIHYYNQAKQAFISLPPYEKRRLVPELRLLNSRLHISAEKELIPAREKEIALNRK